MEYPQILLMRMMRPAKIWLENALMLIMLRMPLLLTLEMNVYEILKETL